MKETIIKITKAKSWFFQKVYKIDKPIARLIKTKRENNLIKKKKTRNEKGEGTTDNAEMQRIVRDHYEQLYGNKIDNLEEMDAVAAAKSLQSCPTLCNPIEGSPPGSPVPGILQARTLEWAAISFSNA